MITFEIFYRQLGGSYADVQSRIPNDDLILRFLGEFLNDPSYQRLDSAFAVGNVRDAFCAAHTLKGVCANLGFEKLRISAGALTEALRSETEKIPQSAFPLLRSVQSDYRNTAEAVSLFLKEKTK